MNELDIMFMNAQPGQLFYSPLIISEISLQCSVKCRDARRMEHHDLFRSPCMIHLRSGSELVDKTTLGTAQDIENVPMSVIVFCFVCVYRAVILVKTVDNYIPQCRFQRAVLRFSLKYQ